MDAGSVVAAGSVQPPWQVASATTVSWVCGGAEPDTLAIVYHNVPKVLPAEIVSVCSAIGIIGLS